MSFLSHLDPATRQRLMAQGEDRLLGAGELLLRRGEAGGDVFLLEDGAMEVVDPRGHPPVVVDTMQPGDVIGELAFLDRSPRAADVRATTACRIRAWRLATLEAELKKDPAFAAAIYESLATTGAERLRAAIASMSAGLRSRLPPAIERDPIVDELLLAFGDAWERADRALLAAALAAIARALLPVAGTWRAIEIGRCLREDLQERLVQARTAQLLLDRGPGSPGGPALHAQLLEGRARGSSPVGVLLDACLLELPVLAGPGRRALAHAATLAGLPLGPGDRVGLLAPGNQALAHRLEATVEGRGALLFPLGLRSDGAADLPALLELLRGRPLPCPPLRALVLDGLPDQLPDRLLQALCGTLALLLGEQGLLLVGYSPGSEDQALVDHLLGWPLLPRGPAALSELLADAAGPGELQPIPEASAEGLLVLRRHRRAP